MPAVKLNATAGAQQGWFDKDIKENILDLPASERDAAALKLKAMAVNGVGPGSQAALSAAMDKDVPTVRDYLRFMQRPDAAAKLEDGAREVRYSTQVVGKLYKAYNIYKAGLDG